MESPRIPPGVGGLSLARQVAVKSEIGKPPNSHTEEEPKAEDPICDEHNFMAKFLREKVFARPSTITSPNQPTPEIPRVGPEFHNVATVKQPETASEATKK